MISWSSAFIRYFCDSSCLLLRVVWLKSEFQFDFNFRAFMTEVKTLNQFISWMNFQAILMWMDALQFCFRAFTIRPIFFSVVATYASLSWAWLCKIKKARFCLRSIRHKVKSSILFYLLCGFMFMPFALIWTSVFSLFCHSLDWCVHSFLVLFMPIPDYTLIILFLFNYIRKSNVIFNQCSNYFRDAFVFA